MLLSFGPLCLDSRLFNTDLNREDSKKIALLLEENKISYQLEDDGQTIMIPKDMIDVWRLKLATLGVSFSGTVGYEVFDKQSFGTTTFVQKVNRQRAFGGESLLKLSDILKVLKGQEFISIFLKIVLLFQKKNHLRPLSWSI